MKTLEFKANVLKLNSLRFIAKEKELFSVLVDSLKLDDKEEFLSDLFFDLVSKFTYLNFKDFLQSFSENIEKYVNTKAFKTKVKNYDEKLFLSENELLKKYYRTKIYKSLPKWFQG